MNGLIVYDYVLFASALGLFLLFIVLAIVLRRKLALSIFLILISFSILALAPTVGYAKMHEWLFKNTTKITSQKRLEFMDAIVLKGTLSNDSEFDFSSCKITANVRKVSKNSLKNYLYQFKTINKTSIFEEDVGKGQLIDFKIIIEPFTYSKDYNITLGAKCK